MAAVLGIALLGTGFATRSGAPPARGGIAATPLDRFLYRDAARARVESALRQVAEDCMAAAGHQYDAPPSPSGPTASPATRYDLVLAPRPEAGHVAESELLPADPAERAAYLVALRGRESPDEIVVVRDPSSGAEVARYYRGGCLAEAELQVFGDWAAYEAVRWTLEDVAVEGWATAERAPAVRQAKAAWRDCVERGGADAACTAESRLVEAWSAEDAAAQQRLLDGREHLLREFDRRWATAVANAEAVLADT